VEPIGFSPTITVDDTVKGSATTMFLDHHDSMVAARCLQVSNTITVPEGMFQMLEGITVFLIHHGSMVAACCP